MPISGGLSGIWDYAKGLFGNEPQQVPNQPGTDQVPQETQSIEREIDIKYRQATLKLLSEVTNTKELMLIKDVIEGIEEMADKCQRVSDSFILLALSL